MNKILMLRNIKMNYREQIGNCMSPKPVTIFINGKPIRSWYSWDYVHPREVAAAYNIYYSKRSGMEPSIHIKDVCYYIKDQIGRYPSEINTNLIEILLKRQAILDPMHRALRQKMYRNADPNNVYNISWERHGGSAKL